MDGTGGLDKTITTNGEQILYVETSGSGASSFFIRSKNGSSATISNVSIKSVEGNVGTMTNQDSADLVYSSVLPDQSFLATGVNSAYNFISLDGSNDYIKNESFTGHQSSKGTLSGWVKLGDVSGYQYLVSVGGTTTTGATRSIAFQNNEVFFAGYGENWVSSATVSADTWYHLSLTWDGTSIILYLNGTGYSQTLSNLVTPTGTKISVGVSAWDFASFINADISGVAVWNKVLSSTEISAIHTAGRHSNLLDSYSDNLKAYYAFGALDSATGFSDTATTIYDRSGNSNHGTTVSIASSDLASSPNATPNGYSKNETNRSTTTP